MSTPGVWSDKDLDQSWDVIGHSWREQAQILTMHWQTCNRGRKTSQLIQNDVSSTKIRLFLRREMSVQYLIPAPVIEYIEEHGLYEDDSAGSMDGKGESRGTESSGRALPAVGEAAGKN